MRVVWQGCNKNIKLTLRKKANECTIPYKTQQFLRCPNSVKNVAIFRKLYTSECFRSSIISFSAKRQRKGLVSKNIRLIIYLFKYRKKVLYLFSQRPRIWVKKPCWKIRLKAILKIKILKQTKNNKQDKNRNLSTNHNALALIEYHRTFTIFEYYILSLS